MNKPEIEQQFETFLDKIKNKEPFAYSHYGDGEMQYITGRSHANINSNTKQKFSNKLKQELISSGWRKNTV